jgi:DNA-binding GntR family transcriptional regulator
MAVSKIKTATSKRQEAYDLVLDAVIFGDIQPDIAIDEKNLAEELGVGLAGMRDALNRLSQEGLVQRHARVGSRVSSLSLSDLQEVFEVRLLVEGKCAALAAERATAEDIAAMRNAFQGFEKIIRQRKFKELVAMDQAFHRKLAASTYNSQFQNIAILMHNKACRFWYFGLTKLPAETVISDIKGHFDVISAIERHDAAGAADAMAGVLGHFPDSVSTFFGPKKSQRRVG